jgi:hypothetical protein
MNILDALKKRHATQVHRGNEVICEKKQLNVDVRPELIQELRKLAAEFAVPQYAVTAQLLEIGAFYIEKALSSNRKKELMRKHLIDKHMLSIGYDDPEELLRLGEGNYASEFVSLSKSIVREASLFRRSIIEAKRTRNIDEVEMAEKRLLNSALMFADWISKHPIDEEPDDEEPNEEDV